MVKVRILNDVDPASAGAYIKQGLEQDWSDLAKESKDKSFYVAHTCMLFLAQHLITSSSDNQLTPKEAYEKAILHFPGANETMVKTLVSQFSVRGEEFQDWVDDPDKMETLWEIEK